MASGHGADQLWACLISLTNGTQYVTLLWRKLKTAVLHSGKCWTSPVQRLLWHKAHFSNKVKPKTHVPQGNSRHRYCYAYVSVNTILNSSPPIPMNCSFKMNGPTKPHKHKSTILCFWTVLCYSISSSIQTHHSVSWCTSKYHGITTERMLSKRHGLKSNTVVTVIGNLVFSIKVFAGSYRTGKDWNLQSVCQDDI